MNKNFATLSLDDYHALFYFERVRSLLTTALPTDTEALEKQYERLEPSQARAALACLCGTSHSVDGSFGQAEHWLNVATADATPGTWLGGWIAAVHAGHLLWNSDLELARQVLHDAGPLVEGPVSPLFAGFVQVDLDIHSGDLDAAARKIDELGRMWPSGQSKAQLHVVTAQLALATDRIDDAEIEAFQGLLLAEPGTRAVPLLFDQLAQVMARRGRLPELEGFHAISMELFAPWPNNLATVHRRFHQLLNQLGIGSQPGLRDRHGEPKALDSAIGVSGIVDLRTETLKALASRDPVRLGDALAALLNIVSDHVRLFETCEARNLALQNLINLSTFIPHIGLAGHADQAFAFFNAAYRLVIIDATRGRQPRPLHDRLVELRSQARETTPPPIGATPPTRLDDPLVAIEHRLGQLDWQSSLALPPRSVEQWSDPPSCTNDALMFGSAEGRFYRFVRRNGETEFSDLGPLAEIEQLIRTIRLTAVALPLGAPRASERLIAAAAALDQRILGDCEWPDGTTLCVMPTADVHSVPWRTLPTLRELNVVVGARGPVPFPSSSRQATVIAGPGLRHDEPYLLETIARHYSEPHLVNDSTLSLGQLVNLCATNNTVHFEARGLLDPLQDSPAEPRPWLRKTRPAETDAHMADIVVLGNCDMEADHRFRGPRLVWIILSTGVRAVISSPIGLADAAARDVIPELHRILATGRPPDEALRLLRFDNEVNQCAADLLLCYMYDE